MAKTYDLIRYLTANNVEFRLLRHVPAFSAHAVAQVTHVPDTALAKTLLVKAGQVYWMAVLQGDQRLSERLLKRALEVHHVHLAHEEDLDLLFPDCEIGAMPPFGNLYGFPVIIDKSLADDDEIVFNACTHSDSIRMKFTEYDRLVHPIIAEIAQPESMAGEEHESWERSSGDVVA
jgi:Ala-tRNA(Pro) deacylase